jgi:hypothetical protein
MASAKLNILSKSNDSIRQVQLDGIIGGSNGGRRQSADKTKAVINEKDEPSTFSESLIDFAIRVINMINHNFSEPFASTADQDQQKRQKRKHFSFLTIGALFGIFIAVVNLIWIQQLGAKMETIFVEMGKVRKKVDQGYGHNRLGNFDQNQEDVSAEQFSAEFNSVLKTQIEGINENLHALENIFTSSFQQVETINQDFAKILDEIK